MKRLERNKQKFNAERPPLCTSFPPTLPVERAVYRTMRFWLTPLRHWSGFVSRLRRRA